MSDLVLETGGDLALAYGIGHLAGTRIEEGEIDLQVKVTIGFARCGGRWLITHQHLSAQAPP
jgi:ketosteroid isomerase-like protein